MKTPVDLSQAPIGRLAKRKWPPYFEVLLIILPIFAGCFAFIAMWNIQETYGIFEILKSILVAVAVTVVSYAVNRFAIEWATDLAASGISAAGWFGGGSILTVGAFLFTFSFSGMVLSDVRYIVLSGFGGVVSEHVVERISDSQKALRTIPIVEGATADFQAKADCEFESACVSGRGSGPGPIWTVLNEKSDRAKAILEQINAGQSRRDETISQLLSLVSAYQTVLDDSLMSQSQKRRALQDITAEIGKSLAELHEAFPSALLAAYAQELKSGVVIPNRNDASRSVSVILQKHGDALDEVLRSTDSSASKMPSFPAKAGMADTFSYIGYFAAIAGVIWIAEGIFPLALFLYTLWYLQRHQQLNGVPSRVADEAYAANAKRLSGSSPKRRQNRNGHRYNGRI